MRRAWSWFLALQPVAKVAVVAALALVVALAVLQLWDALGYLLAGLVGMGSPKAGAAVKARRIAKQAATVVDELGDLADEAQAQDDAQDAAAAQLRAEGAEDVADAEPPADRLAPMRSREIHR